MVIVTGSVSVCFYTVTMVAIACSICVVQVHV